MTPGTEVETLEQAIVERAQALAREQLGQGEQGRERTLDATADRLRLLEERETLTAKAHADRAYRRSIEASELRLQAELDSMRWALVQTVMERLREKLARFSEDEAAYPPLFKRLLAQAAVAIERDTLVAAVNDRDHRRFAETWEALAHEAAPGKEVTLSTDHYPCTGGLLVASEDNRIRVDNTFEGRIERLAPEIHRVAIERLFPSPV